MEDYFDFNKPISEDSDFHNLPRDQRASILRARTQAAGQDLQYACHRMKEWRGKSLFEQIFGF